MTTLTLLQRAKLGNWGVKWEETFYWNAFCVLCHTIVLIENLIEILKKQLIQWKNTTSSYFSTISGKQNNSNKNPDDSQLHIWSLIAQAISALCSHLLLSPMNNSGCPFNLLIAPANCSLHVSRQKHSSPIYVATFCSSFNVLTIPSIFFFSLLKLLRIHCYLLFPSWFCWWLLSFKSPQTHYKFLRMALGCYFLIPSVSCI